ARAGPVALVTAPSAAGGFLALARSETFRIGDRAFALVGGVAVDGAWLARLARDREIAVTLRHPDGELASPHGAGSPAGEVVVRDVTLPLIVQPPGAPVTVTQA